MRVDYSFNFEDAFPTDDAGCNSDTLQRETRLERRIVMREFNRTYGEPYPGNESDVPSRGVPARGTAGVGNPGGGGGGSPSDSTVGGTSNRVLWEPPVEEPLRSGFSDLLRQLNEWTSLPPYVTEDGREIRPITGMPRCRVQPVLQRDRSRPRGEQVRTGTAV